MDKQKLGLWLVENGYYSSRSQANYAIKNSKITVNGRIVTKDGYLVSDTDEIIVNDEVLKYVSRGGNKLEAALKAFKIDLNGITVLDIGASTGGFTDCCLQNGARRVYSYDVGTSQLHEKLLNNPRVISKEQINCRYLKKNDFPEEIDFICMDVSFISCTKMFEAISDILSQGKKCVILFKPQFEVGNEYLCKKGIVTDQKAALNRLNDCKEYAEQLQLKLVEYIPSPVKGQDGNQEYLLYFVRN